MNTLSDTYRHKGLRRKLVDLLKKKGIANPAVLGAINQVPRHLFFDNAFLEHAYQDKAFPIGDGQTISQPYTVARQTELLDVRPGDKVLEIGTGSGYQACVLMELGVDLYSIERFKTLHSKAKDKLNSMGYFPKLFCGDGTAGLATQAPFDRIIVTAGAPSVPKPLLDQLVVGGKLIIPVGDAKNQAMIRITKKGTNQIDTENFGDFKFVPLKGRYGWQEH